MTRSVMTVIAVIVLVAMTSGSLSHYLTKAAMQDALLQRVVARKPVTETQNSHVGENQDSDVGEKTNGGDNPRATTRSSVENSVSEMRREFPLADPKMVLDLVKSAVERIEQAKSEGSQPHGPELDSTQDRES